MQQNEHSLLTGPVLPSLLRFAFPVILSMVTTQLYSTVDTMIVGRMLDANALAAVSNASAVLMVFLFISGGIELGGNLLIASNRPTATNEEMNRLTYNLLFCDVALGLLMLVLGIVGTNGLLQLIQTPAEIRSQAAAYIRVYLFGLPFLMLYDLSKEILIGYGEPKIPMYAVIVTSVINLVLDIPCVALWGVAGAAAATAFSQFVGALYCLWVLRQHLLCTSFSFSLLQPHYAKDIARLSVPNAIQQASGPVVTLIRQGLLGTLGVAAIAGYSCTGKITSVLMYPVYGLIQALVVFIAQNTAAHNTARIHDGIRKSRWIILSYTGVIIAVCLSFSEALMGLFTHDADTIQYGASLLVHIIPTYFLTSISYVQNAKLRGWQKMGLYLVSDLVPTGLGIVSLIFLVPHIGYNGFYISPYISAICGVILSTLLTHRAEHEMRQTDEPLAT